MLFRRPDRHANKTLRGKRNITLFTLNKCRSISRTYTCLFYHHESDWRQPCIDTLLFIIMLRYYNYFNIRRNDIFQKARLPRHSPIVSCISFILVHPNIFVFNKTHVTSVTRLANDFYSFLNCFRNISVQKIRTGQISDRTYRSNNRQ
jgi:hypothetical protein